MKVFLIMGIIISTIAVFANAEYVEIGTGSSALLSRPYCGN